MGRLSVRRTIEAPVEVVFAYVDDHRNITRFMKDLTTWEPAGDVVHGKGARFKVGMKAGPLNLTSTVEITAWKQNSTIGFTARDGFRQSGTWSFVAEGTGTATTLDLEYELPGGIAGRVAGRAAEPIMRSNLEKSIGELKAQAERLPGARAAARPAPAKASAAASAKASGTASAKVPAARGSSRTTSAKPAARKR